MSRRQRKSNARATIHDVASVAQVSPMTVSRVINGSPGVAATTRARVMAAVDALGFLPSDPARRLAQGGGCNILVYCTLPGDDIADLFAAADSIGESQGAKLHLRILKREEAAGIREHQALVASHSLSGAILMPSVSDARWLHQLLGREGIPVVAVEGNYRATWRVSTDEYAAFRDMALECISLGHRSIALLDRARGGRESLARRGFEAALNQRGVPTTGSYLEVPADFRNGMNGAERLLASDPAITAILSGCDVIAAGASEAAQRRGKCVPRDLSVIGYGDAPIATRTVPELTTIRTSMIELVHKAIELLKSRDVPGSIQIPQWRHVAHQVVYRKSLGPAPPALHRAERPAASHSVSVGSLSQ